VRARRRHHRLARPAGRARRLVDGARRHERAGTSRRQPRRGPPGRCAAR
jgi:hypothetical protein